MLETMVEEILKTRRAKSYLFADPEYFGEKLEIEVIFFCDLALTSKIGL